MNKPTCETCPYYLLIYNESQTGECFKNVPVVTSHDRVTSFPRTQSHKWCGGHPDFPKWLENLKELERSGRTLDESQYYEKCEQLTKWFEDAILKNNNRYSELEPIAKIYNELEYKKRDAIFKTLISDLYRSLSYYNILEFKEI